MLVPAHALYAAGASLLPPAVFVSTTTATSYVALPEEYPLAGRSRTSYLPFPVAAACTTTPPPCPLLSLLPAPWTAQRSLAHLERERSRSG